MESLLNNCQIAWNISDITTTTNRSSPFVDMAGYESCLFMLLGSTLSGSSKITAVLQGATADSTATVYTQNATPISSSTAFGAAASRNDKVLALDAVRPMPYRYLRMRVSGSTGIDTNDKFLTIQYNPRKGASTQASTSFAVGAVSVTNTTY